MSALINLKESGESEGLERVERGDDRARGRERRKASSGKCMFWAEMDVLEMCCQSIRDADTKTQVVMVMVMVMSGGWEENVAKIYGVKPVCETEM
jgi:hypothetical protein